LKQVIKSIKSVIKKEGLFRGLIIIPLRIIQYLYYKTFKKRSFTVGGKAYPYFYHLRNATFLKERAVEIAIGIDLLNEYRGKSILEVGNVMDQYYPVPHDVVDKYEKGEGVINEDIITYKPGKKYDLIITISTMEHVGWDETPRTKDKFIAALNYLKELLDKGGLLFVTIPIGYNDDIDNSLREKKFPLSDVHYMKKTGKDCRWTESKYEEVKDIKCNLKYLSANALLVGFYKKA